MMDHELPPQRVPTPTRCPDCGVVFPAPENYYSHMCNPMMLATYKRQKEKEQNMTDHTQRQVGGNHYKTMKIQPEKYIWENGIPFHEGNVIKYVSRWRTKGGLQDLEKAAHFLDLLIQHEKGKEEQKCKKVDDAYGPAMVIDPRN